MLKIGSFVTRKKYGNDILFKVVEINEDKVILKGVDLRLYADSNISDLELATISKKKEIIINKIRKINSNNYFFIPGVILHFDSDKDYLDKCLEYYKNQKVKCIGYIFKESEYSKKIEKIIKEHKPNILVITGHDAYYKDKNKYRNSEYFIETVKVVRKIISSNNDLIVIAGACQSDFNNLIKNGATYASSPSHINIHALDPAIIASYIALSENNKLIDLEDILSKTNYGKDGIGGIQTMGVMKIGMPRKDKIEY